MLFLFIFRLLRRLFLVFVQLLQNGRFFLRLFPFLGFTAFARSVTEIASPAFARCSKSATVGVCGRIVDKPVKIVVVLLYGVLDVL